jgi:DNA-binding NtrC family response regulator
MIATAATGTNRTVLLASSDASLRQRLNLSLSGLRWQVHEAEGGADALAQLEGRPVEALLLDNWLPDLEVGEFTGQIRSLYPDMDLLRIDGDPIAGSTRSPRRHELLHALREAHGASRRADGEGETSLVVDPPAVLTASAPRQTSHPDLLEPEQPHLASVRPPRPRIAGSLLNLVIDEMVGQSPEMLELARLIRLVAPRPSTVLIEGETGTGKEVVARALHRLGPRSAKPFVVLNCAAIPEALLEAELFGHTRGAFTGAVQSRIGRIEAAHGGTLFLDEIGEMPLALQSKMLRFLESGELQRVGDNEISRVDVRIIAATHQALDQRATEGSFRLDLYHRLAVFPVEVPPLRERVDDIALLAEHFLALMGKSAPRKTLSLTALEKLRTHSWPGNVRELAHVLERACILAEDAPEIRPEDIRMRREPRR